MNHTHILPLTCPSCGAQIKIPEGSNRFTCGYCGNEHLLQINIQPAAPVKTVLRPRVPAPASVRIVKDGQAVTLVQRWFSAKYIFMAFFAVAWDGFLIFWYGMALGSGAPLIFVLFPLVHLAVGVYITYSTLAGFLNSTNLELSKDELVVWFAPLPWPGEKTIQTADIKQLFCREKVSHSRKGGTSYSYELHAITKADVDIKLVSGVESAEVARYFEQQLEEWLKIEDQRVSGELR